MLPDDTYPIWFVLVFVWVGLNQPPRHGLAMTPVAILSFAAPIAFGIPISAATATSLTIAVPVSVLIAESLARRSAAIEQAECARQVALAALTRANLTDDLTGIGNRRHANALLENIADGEALVLLDLDNFKSINDTYGHPRGDLVLQELGSFLVGRLSDRDDCARYGGEEFLAILRKDVEDYRADVYRLLQDWRDTRPLTTFSAGVAVKRRSETWSETLAAADSALYAAKEAGRDTAAFEGKRKLNCTGWRAGPAITSTQIGDANEPLAPNSRATTRRCIVSHWSIQGLLLSSEIWSLVMTSTG